MARRHGQLIARLETATNAGKSDKFNRGSMP